MDKAANVEEKVREYIVKHLMLKHGGTELGLDQPLLESGIMTSFGIVELVSYMERTFGVTVDDYDVVPENFQTVRAIAQLVHSKRS